MRAIKPHINLQYFRKSIELGLLANNRGVGYSYQQQFCECDLSVGFFCRHCAIDSALRQALALCETLHVDPHYQSGVSVNSD